MEKLILSFIFFSILIGKRSEFIVTFIGMNTASVYITEKDTIFDGVNSKSIEYETRTISTAKRLFPVDNHYHTIINNEFNRILYFDKKTSQPWLKNVIIAKNKNGKVQYEGSNIEIPNKYQNIFTLLQYLNHESVENIINRKFYMDREGMRFEANFELINSNDEYEEIQLILNPIMNQINTSIVESTDIFTWAVFKNNSVRILRISKFTGKLIYCEFSSGFVTMKATLVNK